MPDPVGGREAEREAVARAIWTRMTELQDDPERGQCWSMPLETRRGPTTPWELSEGAWHTQTLELADAALDAVRSSGSAAQNQEEIIASVRTALELIGARDQFGRPCADLIEQAMRDGLAARSPQDEDQ